MCFLLYFINIYQIIDFGKKNIKFYEIVYLVKERVFWFLKRRKKMTNYEFWLKD